NGVVAPELVVVDAPIHEFTACALGPDPVGVAIRIKGIVTYQASLCGESRDLLVLVPSISDYVGQIDVEFTYGPAKLQRHTIFCRSVPTFNATEVDADIIELQRNL